MSSTPQQPHADPEVAALLERLAAVESVQSNCMFQLAVIVARIAAEPCAESYKDETAQTLLALIRGKPKSNVVRLFGAAAGSDRPELRQSAQA